MIITVAMTEKWRGAFFAPDEWSRLRGLGDVRQLPEPLTLTPATLAGTEVLVTGWETPALDETTVAGCPDLRAIVHSGGSVRYLVPPGIYDAGIEVANQADINAIPVAQYCLAQILLAAKGTRAASRQYRATHRLTTFEEPTSARPVGVYGATVGLIGSSRVSRRLMELLRPFDMIVSMSSPYLTPAEAAAAGARLVPVEDAMRCDVVSVHLGDTPDNVGAVTAELLALMPDGATFINTARGIVVDEAALIREVATGRIDAVLDVTWPEIPADDSPLWRLPNVTLTPHWAGSLGRELHRLGQGVVDDVEQFVNGQPMTGRVDPATAAYLA